MTPDLRLAAELLGVAPDEHDEKVIRRAYLRAIKKAPPEREPERFQALREAYEALQHIAQRDAAMRAFHAATSSTFGRGDTPTGGSGDPSADEVGASFGGRRDGLGEDGANAPEPLAASSLEPGEADERERKAVEAFEIADSVDDALAVAEAALAQHPERPWPYLLLVRARLERGEVELALAVARDATARGFHEPLVEAAWLAREALSESERATVEAQLEPWPAAALFATFDAPRAERAMRAVLASAREEREPLPLALFARVVIDLEALGASAIARALHREVRALCDVVGEARAVSPREGLFARWVHELASLPDDFDPSLRAALVRVVAQPERESELATWAASRSIAARSVAQRVLAEHAPRVAEAFGATLNAQTAPANQGWNERPPSRDDLPPDPRGWNTKKTSWDTGRRDPLELDTWETPPAQTHADRHWQVWILVMACMAALPRVLVSLASYGTSTSTTPITRPVSEFGYGGRGLGPATTSPPSEPVAPDSDALNELLCRDPSRPECEDALRVGQALRDEDCDAATEAWERLESAFPGASDDVLRDVDVRLVALRRADVRALCQRTRHRHARDSADLPTDSPASPDVQTDREMRIPSREESPP